MKKKVCIIGCLILVAGWAVFLWPYSGPSEKPGAFYALGHWFDLSWELGLSLIGIGLLTVIFSAMVGLGREPT
ncbi:MAG: hypothetical protein JRJ19_08600 [Deltaproteobacteria bacterium]|nr:hypothetical protein [Deltaproteobacteria bacterium]MBW1872109.1 hypothetical protein [Deltaproteobacteria bacterium]